MTADKKTVFEHALFRELLKNRIPASIGSLGDIYVDNKKGVYIAFVGYHMIGDSLHLHCNQSGRAMWIKEWSDPTVEEVVTFATEWMETTR